MPDRENLDIASASAIREDVVSQDQPPRFRDETRSTLVGKLGKLPLSTFECFKESLSRWRSEEHTSELQSHHDLVCRLLLEKKNKKKIKKKMRNTTSKKH